MVFRLICDISPHLRQVGWAYGERTVSLLPGECGSIQILFHPSGRNRLQFPHEIRETMRRLQPHQQMNVIGDPAVDVGESVQSRHRTAQVSMKFWQEIGIEPRFPVRRAENDVVMERGVSRGHGKSILYRPCRDWQTKRAGLRWFARGARFTTGYRCIEPPVRRQRG